MPSPYDRERIENWAADFVGTPAFHGFSGGTREYASEILATLLASSCDTAGAAPEQLGVDDLRAGLLGGVARLELPASVAREIPDLVAAFLEQLEREGRVSDGRGIGLRLRAMRAAFLEASGAARTPHRRPAPKVGPNQPCPCGSGRKFKKCCQGLLD